jgi:hypothetical protein
MAVLTVLELKKYLRYEAADTSNDDPLGLIVDGGQRYIENYTGHLLVRREVVESPAAFPTARRTGEVPYYDLRWKPYVADSLEVGYLDGAYEAATFEAVTIYSADGTTRIIPTAEWPGEYLGITFTYTAGYENLAAVPDDLLHALAVYAGMSDEDRAAPNSDGWRTVHALLDFYRLPVLA